MYFHRNIGFELEHVLLAFSSVQMRSFFNGHSVLFSRHNQPFIGLLLLRFLCFFFSILFVLMFPFPLFPPNLTFLRLPTFPPLALHPTLSLPPSKTSLISIDVIRMNSNLIRCHYNQPRNDFRQNHQKIAQYTVHSLLVTTYQIATISTR